MFYEVTARPDYVKLEQRILQLWTETRAFEKLRQQTKNGHRWSFLDGPITANNPMGVHHAWGRTYKDIYNRYHAMLGHELRWQQGFDCQGLWVEVEVEKELGFKDKHQIESYGVDRFVEKCKERVYRFADVQTEQSKRLGYWMDWDNSYYTLSDENNYSIWGFLKHCHNQGWLYRGNDVMPWCPRCGTALSEHEIATEGYVDTTHLAMTVAFPLLDRPNEALLIWTTTPWTLPANVAAAINPELTYVRFTRTNTETQQHSFWMVKGAFSKLHKPSWQAEEERLGAELVGWRYRGPFDAFEAQQDVEHRVLPWDEVSETEGTGVVHIAPGAGKEDFALGHTHQLTVLAPLDESGTYVDGYGWLTGQQVGNVAETIANHLAQNGLLFAREMYQHRYPVCWRCGTELVFRLVDEWLINMDELRLQMMDAAQTARWIPTFGLERELDWLRNMDDWMISKKRYWGLALPIYPCESCGHITVVGSKEELQECAAEGWDEFAGHSPHRPWIDAVKIACPMCDAPVSRVADVGNPWLDAGIVAFSTLNYRQNRSYWEQWFPADLVLESFPGQFRNWFYALLAMSTALEGQSPFKTLLGYALVKDVHGAEMHKSKGNSIPFEVAADWLGVEPLRWMFASAPLERNLHFGRQLAEETARRLQPLWEVYRFFVTYARLDGWTPTWTIDDQQITEVLLRTVQEATHNVLDRWLLARLYVLVTSVQEQISNYDVRSCTLAVEAFLDDLSNWYVRRSRRRFWNEARGTAQEDKHTAYTTLHITLITLTRTLAPMLPFLSEELYQNLVRAVDPAAPESVHLTGYPTFQLAEKDSPAFQSNVKHLLRNVEIVRRVVNLGRAARKSAGVRVRQPLGRVLVAIPQTEDREALLQLQNEVLDELNVKTLEVIDSSTRLLDYQVKPNLRLLGPRLGKQLPALRRMLEQLDQSTATAIAQAVEQGQTVELQLDGETITLNADELLIETAALEGYAVAQEAGLQVALDTTLTEELHREGMARDLVRAIQDVRKNAGLALSDRITLYVSHHNSIESVLAEWEVYVRNETLAEHLRLEAPPADAHVEEVTLNGQMVEVGVVS